MASEDGQVKLHANPKAETSLKTYGFGRNKASQGSAAAAQEMTLIQTTRMCHVTQPDAKLSICFFMNALPITWLLREFHSALLLKLTRFQTDLCNKHNENRIGGIREKQGYLWVFFRDITHAVQELESFK